MERQRETCLGQSKSERTNITERNSNERLVNENDTRKRFFFSLVADNILHFCSLLIFLLTTLSGNFVSDLSILAFFVMTPSQVIPGYAHYIMFLITLLE